MPVAILTKAGSYQTALIPGKQFKFETPVSVSEEEKLILRETDWFKFEEDEDFEKVETQDVAAPKGGVIIRKGVKKLASAASAEDGEGVVV